MTKKMSEKKKPRRKEKPIPPIEDRGTSHSSPFIHSLLSNTANSFQRAKSKPRAAAPHAQRHRRNRKHRVEFEIECVELALLDRLSWT